MSRALLGCVMSLVIAAFLCGGAVAATPAQNPLPAQTTTQVAGSMSEELIDEDSAPETRPGETTTAGSTTETTASAPSNDLSTKETGGIIAVGVFAALAFLGLAYAFRG